MCMFVCGRESHGTIYSTSLVTANFSSPSDLLHLPHHYFWPWWSLTICLLQAINTLSTKYCTALVQVSRYLMRAQVMSNPLTSKLFNLNFHSLEVVSRWRDPQLQVSENYSDLTTWRSSISNIADWCHILSLTCLKGGT